MVDGLKGHGMIMLAFLGHDWESVDDRYAGGNVCNNVVQVSSAWIKGWEGEKLIPCIGPTSSGAAMELL
jgi:hypothetical protein